MEQVLQESGISPGQRRAWRMLTRTHGRLIEGVERALVEAELPPLAWFNVLDALAQADQQSLRPRDMGCGVQISRSGLTRLLDRMEAGGAVERARCDEDRRGSYVRLTESGVEMAVRMREVIDTELAVSFGGLIDDAQAERLTELLGLIAGDDE